MAKKTKRRTAAEEKKHQTALDAQFLKAHGYARKDETKLQRTARLSAVRVTNIEVAIERLANLGNSNYAWADNQVDYVEQLLASAMNDCIAKLRARARAGSKTNGKAERAKFQMPEAK